MTMRLTLELKDDALINLIDAKLSQKVAEIVGSRIEDRIIEVMEKKLARMNLPAELQKQFAQHFAVLTERAVNETLGEDPTTRRATVTELVKEVALKLLKRQV